MPYHPKTNAKRALTPNQKKLFEWIVEYKKKNNEMPTQVEMAKRFKVTPASIRDRLVYISKKGYLEMGETRIGSVKPRGLKVLKKP